MVIVRKHELGKYKIITGDGMFLPHTTRAKVCILVEDTINLRDKGVSDINLAKKEMG